MEFIGNKYKSILLPGLGSVLCGGTRLPPRRRERVHVVMDLPEGRGVLLQEERRVTERTWSQLYNGVRHAHLNT